MKHVIVVEAELVAKLLKNVLEEAGYETVAVQNPKEAVRMCQEKQFDILMTGQTLPETIKGTDLIGTLKELQPNLKTVLLSGGPVPDHPADLFIFKPFNIAKMLKRIESL